MSTKETEKKVESTSATTEIKTSDNKNIFGPLGKYAVVAVIMVSIIVTTAIMLNKQLGSVTEQLAVMEIEVTEIYAANSTDAVASDATIKTTETAEATEIEVTAAEVQTTEVQAVEAPSAEVLVATENTVKETVSAEIISTEQTSSTDAAVIKPAIDKYSAEDEHQHTMAKRDQERQARIECTLGKRQIAGKQRNLAREAARKTITGSKNPIDHDLICNDSPRNFRATAN